MNEAIGDVLPFAVGVALSPIPIIAIILVLLSAHPGKNSVAFLGGWIVGITAATFILLLVAGAITDSSDSSTSSSRTLLGVALIVLAVRSFRKRPKEGEEPELPKWMETMEDLTPGKAAGLGVLLSAVNPKNVMLIGAGMLAVAQYNLSGSDEIVAVVAFILIAISSVTIPVVIYQVKGDKAQPTLDSMRVWLEQNNATVMAVVLLVMGVVVLGKGAGSL